MIPLKTVCSSKILKIHDLSSPIISREFIRICKKKKKDPVVSLYKATNNTFDLDLEQKGLTKPQITVT